MNSVLFQYFEWYLPADSQHWNRLKDSAAHLASLGISAVWMPPAFKATSKDDVGYGVYDLFDLGEFDQNGTVPTKYGSKEEYLQAIQALKAVGISPLADIVLNHKANGDQKETFTVIEMDPNQRQTPISEPFEIEGWTHFSFPCRHKQYSDFEWHWYHFTGTDFDAKTGRTGIFMIQGDNKGWAEDGLVDDENGNYDYLMFTDVDFKHPEVRQHLDRWVKWFIETTGIKGFRLDAIKHIDSFFMANFIRHIKEDFGEDFYVFGEYWQPDLEKKENYLEAIDYGFDLVDVGLHNNFFTASKNGASYDLTKLLDGSLMKEFPSQAVTFVDNHDTQRGQALESTVEDWFKPMAYAVILLMKHGLPTIFYGDYFGVDHPEFGQAAFGQDIDALLGLRQSHAYGEEVQYFDDPNCIGWVRQGDQDHPDPMAVILSNAESQEKVMQVGPQLAGRQFIDALGHIQEAVTIDEEGNGLFLAPAGSLAVWIPANP